jgi:gliding motility-associated-like protein
VDQPPAISVDLGVDQIICENDSILLDPIVPGGVTYDYLWSDGSTSSTLWVYTDGEYWVQIQGDCDQGRDTVQIDPYVEAPFSLGSPPASICDGLTDTLYASYPGAISYEWPDFSTDSFYIVSTSGDYWAIAYHECGSTSSDTVTYVFENCACNIFIPNAFSPNLQGPGQNEHFRVTLSSDCFLLKYQIAIYDRWGKEVFYSEDINQPWDGTFEGMDCQQGVYMYRIYYELPNFTRIDIKTATGYLYLLK